MIEQLKTERYKGIEINFVKETYRGRLITETIIEYSFIYKGTEYNDTHSTKEVSFEQAKDKILDLLAEEVQKNNQIIDSLLSNYKIISEEKVLIGQSQFGETRNVKFTPDGTAYILHNDDVKGLVGYKEKNNRMEKKLKWDH
jgi:hypothetical protein